MPGCGHKRAIKCSDNPALSRCHTPCLKLCSNGLHGCPLECFHCFTRGCSPCTVNLIKKMPECGHEQTMACHKDPIYELCYNHCSKSCPEGHSCQKLCHEPCGDCVVHVERMMPICGHKQKMRCFVTPSEHNCRRKCNKVYVCGHFCPKKCHEPCDIDCTEEVVKSLPKCGHKESMACHHSPALFHCTSPCEKCLSCGHFCKQECGSECDLTKCVEIVQHKLPCGHTASIQCKDKFTSLTCREICRKRLPCGHECRNKCSESCVELCHVHVNTTCINFAENLKTTPEGDRLRMSPGLKTESRAQITVMN